MYAEGDSWLLWLEGAAPGALPRVSFPVVALCNDVFYAVHVGE